MAKRERRRGLLLLEEAENKAFSAKVAPTCRAAMDGVILAVGDFTRGETLIGGINPERDAEILRRRHKADKAVHDAIEATYKRCKIGSY